MSDLNEYSNSKELNLSKKLKESLNPVNLIIKKDTYSTNNWNFIENCMGSKNPNLQVVQFSIP